MNYTGSYEINRPLLKKKPRSSLIKACFKFFKCKLFCNPKIENSKGSFGDFSNIVFLKK